MSSHSDRFRSRTGLFPQGLKFPGLQGLCMGGLDSSAYLSNAMGSPAVMVLSSTCGGDIPPHSQSHVSFATRRTDGKDTTGGGGLSAATSPFPNPGFPVRPLFGQGDPYSLSSPLLSLHHPLLATHAFRNSYFNPGAFRPLGLSSEDRNGSAFHGSAFMPAKCVKLDGTQGGDGTPQSLLLGPCYQGGESGFHQSPANSTGSSLGHGTGGTGGYMDGKEDRTDSDSIVDGPDRLSETPNLSEESRSIERSTPEERGTPKRHKKYYVDGQTPYCPICMNPVQSSELPAHYEYEVDKLLEMSKCISQQIEVSSMHSPFSSPLCMVRKDDKSKPESRWETYQRVKGNRTSRLTTGRCIMKRKKWDDPTDRTQDDHLLPPALRKREGMEVDSAEASSIDSRADFNWAVTARLHAIASFQRSLPVPDYGARKFEVTEDENQELNVDGDDSATYGQPHYTEADVITCSTEDNADNKEQIRRIQSNDSNYQRHPESSQWGVNGGNNNGEGQEVTSTCVTNNDASDCVSPSDKTSKQSKESSGENAKDHIEDGIKCLICMEPFIKPVVSICCWHVHCEECWLKTLGTKKLCPQCNMITSPRDLRRIYL